MTEIKNIVASGCSQTADGIGGVPISSHQLGGCSYVDQGDGSAREANSWLGFVAKDLQVQSLVNLAAGGHGNQYISHTLIDFLSRNSYPTHNTMVLFNLSQPERLDIPCAFDHPDRCNYVSYDESIISHSWLKPHSLLHQKFVKNIGFEQIFCQSRIAVLALLAFLKNRGYHYKFICMRNYLKDPHLGPCCQDSNRIDLNPGGGMVEFARETGLLKADGLHPTTNGHRLIANQVLARIKF